MSTYRAADRLLAGRHVLITGAGDGIGRAVAVACARHGAGVILLGRTLSKLEQVYDQIENLGAPTPALLPLDLATASPAHYEELAHTVEKEFGRLDGLLHNAADVGTLTPLEHYPSEQWYRVLQTNLSSAWLLTRACLPLLRRADDASIIFTSADVGRRGRAYWGAYGISCFGLEGMMQILADELASEGKIRVNSLDPGTVATGLRARLYPAERASWPAPEQVVPAYLYLLGPDSHGVHGQALNARDYC